MSLPSMTDLTISITMNSDWHIGAGSGQGDIDSVVQRDSDELPYIPAKTLTGILRDSCEQAALALDNGETSGKWHNWVNFLFGNQPNSRQRPQAEIQAQLDHAPRPAAVAIRSAHLSTELRDALKARPQLKPAVTFIKPGVAIDPETGSAQSQQLRFEEVARKGARLSTKCCFDFSGYPDMAEDQKQQKIALALLLIGAKLVERIGGKRRRGNGNCTISILDNNQTNELLQWLERKYAGIQEPPSWEQPALGCESQVGEANQLPADQSAWFAVPLTITTRSPVVLPKRTVGNVVECLDYIPGRYFLGLLHRALGHQIDVSQAIACGDCIMTNATIAIDGIAGRPTPFCLFGEKLEGGLSKGKKVYNRFQETEPKDDAGRDIQAKGERSGYLGRFDGEILPEYKTVNLKINTHNTIDDRVQRPTPDEGGAVYSYQAIAAQQTFKAELRLSTPIKEQLDAAEVDWWKRLGGDMRIGQSKKDQYGAVHIEVDEPKQVTFSKQMYKRKQRDEEKLLYVWFLSDVLLRNQRLTPTTDPNDFKDELVNALGVGLEERQDEHLLSLMMRSQRTESWQVRWGLPRPSMLGWQAGSCVVYEIQGDKKPTAEKLAELEAKGIGDRRAEGYGQICFNDPLLMNSLSKLEREELSTLNNPSKLKEISRNEPAFDYARLIEEAAWRTVIEQKSLGIAADAENRKRILGIEIAGSDSCPPMSQLGGLRSAFRHLTSRTDANSISRWVEAIQKVDNRKNKWLPGSLEKIHSLATEDERVWQELESYNKEIGNFDDLIITQNGKAELKATLWVEAVKTLVDAMIRAHKRDLEKTQKAA